MTLKAGSAFIMTSTGGFSNPGGGHLCVCLTGPCDKGDVITVTIQTYHPGFDTSCVLDVGDHDKIVHKSVAAYARSAKNYAKKMQGLIDGGTYTPQPDVSPEVLAKLRSGLMTSGDTPRFILEYAKKRGLN